METTIIDARKIMKKHNLPFATIWKIGESYGFNFENKPIGHIEKQDGIEMTVINIIR
jgi:hypothetical protein